MLFFIYYLLAFTSASKCFYSVTQEKTGNKTWWFINPQGQRWISKGVDTISIYGTTCPTCNGTLRQEYLNAAISKYGNQANWLGNITNDLKSWGFNSAGAWADVSVWSALPYTILLNVANLTPGGNWALGRFADYFSAEFANTADTLAAAKAGTYYLDENLIGYFTDNEINWKNLLEKFYNLSATSAGRAAAIDTLKVQYNNSILALNQDWNISAPSFENISFPFPSSSKFPGVKTAENNFLRKAATQYFKVCHDAIRKYDPYHLIMGCKVAGNVADIVWQSMAPYNDVLSLDYYKAPLVASDFTTFNSMYTVVNNSRPFLIAEFSVRARDSGLPNTHGAGPLVDTQAERAGNTSMYVHDIMGLPWFIGYHWFEFSDEPAGGRFDGEDSNYGLYNNSAFPYTLLVDAFTDINKKAESLHGSLTSELVQKGAKCWDVVQCPKNCSKMGCCDLSQGACVCAPGWSGLDCTINNANWTYNFPTFNDSQLYVYWWNNENIGISNQIGFRKTRATVNNSAILQLDNINCPSDCVNLNYSSAMFTWSKKSNYGTTTARVRVAKGSGIANLIQSSTGPWVTSADITQRVWIRVLGRNNTDQVQFGWEAANGSFHNSFALPLVNVSVDLSLDYHDYSINWTSTGVITFWIDGKLYGTILQNTTKLTSIGRFEVGLDMMNTSFWGFFHYSQPIHMYVQSVSFLREGGFVYPTCGGCTNIYSCDYNPTATYNDGTCGKKCNGSTNLAFPVAADFVQLCVLILVLMTNAVLF